jgi:hypothetical protein
MGERKRQRLFNNGVLFKYKTDYSHFTKSKTQKTLGEFNGLKTR